jgi:predicted RNase H-like HicB family nuclease
VAVRRFKVVLEWDPDESLWETYVPALNHLSTYGETRESALVETREAILGYIEAAEKEDLTIPDSDPLVEVAEIEVAIV